MIERRNMRTTGIKELLKVVGAGKAICKDRSFSVSAGREIKISVNRELSKELKAIRQSLYLVNTKKKISSPINSLKILDLPLNVTLKNDPYAVGFGSMAGMGNTGYYPPPAYRVQEVFFGEKAKGDVNMSPTRWWSGHRYFELKSGVDGSHGSGNLPIMLFGWKDGGRERGLWIALEWSGRWHMECSTGEDGRFTLSAAIPVKNMVLKPNETLELPAVHLGYFEGGRHNGFNAVRRYIMKEIAPDAEGKRPEALLAYDHWMGIHGELTEKNIWPQVRAASALGLEYFVIDAGWFGGMEKGWSNAVGNWEGVNKKKFPRGLKPLADHAKANGLRFGLWFEPERAAKGSDWLKKYPKGYLKAGKQEGGYIDFSQKAMQDAVIEMLSKHIRQLDIRWLRWDYNQTPGAFWDEKDPTG
jgi:alpha-galactosidase